MNYVVVDFEWNQSMGRRREHRPRMPFEIIEIGAVMLDESLDEIDRFSQTVRPRVYRKLHRITGELTGITQHELDHSEPFPYVLVDFMLWCGDDFTFCTWGNGDLTELQRNMKYYHLEDLLEGPLKYYNVQKLYRELVNSEQRSASLESAVEYMGIPAEKSFHRAINDAGYTAKVLQQMDMDRAKDWFSVDYYCNPRSKEEEIHLSYEDHYKFISREFDSREKALTDREVRSVRCYRCGRSARRLINWFSGKSHVWYYLGTCPEHGYLRGKIRIKTTDSGRLFVVKTIRVIDEEKAETLRVMKREIVEKRREKRR